MKAIYSPGFIPDADKIILEAELGEIAPKFIRLLHNDKTVIYLRKDVADKLSG